MSITHAVGIKQYAQSQIAGSGRVTGTYTLDAETISAGGFAADIKTDAGLPVEPDHVNCYDEAGGLLNPVWIKSTKKIKIADIANAVELTGSQSLVIQYEAIFQAT